MATGRQPTTRLREHMRQDLQLRNYSPQTIECYIRCVANFAHYFHTPPDQLGPEHVRQYQLQLVHHQQASWSLVMQSVYALRFFYNITLDRPYMLAYIPQPKRPKTLPTILSPHEVAALLQAPRHLKSRAILATLYAAGLRVSELCQLHVTDVDSTRMVMHIRQGKGQQDRYVMLSPRLLVLLRQYWQQFQPRTWLFPGPDPFSQNIRTCFIMVTYPTVSALLLACLSVILTARGMDSVEGPWHGLATVAGLHNRIGGRGAPPAELEWVCSLHSQRPMPPIAHVA